jgi:hypothetical protein
MPNRNYRRGYRVENNLTKKMKEEYSFRLAVRSAGSHSPVDVWGFRDKDDCLYIVQCKVDKKLVDRANTRKLKNIVKDIKGIRAFDVWPEKGRFHWKQVAEKQFTSWIADQN